MSNKYTLTNTFVDEIKATKEKDGKIQAIKYIRHILKPFIYINLKDAKGLVDQIAADAGYDDHNQHTSFDLNEPIRYNIDREKI